MFNDSHVAGITPEDKDRAVVRSLGRTRGRALRCLNVRELLTNVARQAAADAAKFKVVLDILARSELLASAEDLAYVPE